MYQSLVIFRLTTSLFVGNSLPFSPRLLKHPKAPVENSVGYVGVKQGSDKKGQSNEYEEMDQGDRGKIYFEFRLVHKCLPRLLKRRCIHMMLLHSPQWFVTLA